MSGFLPSQGSDNGDYEPRQQEEDKIATVFQTRKTATSPPGDLDEVPGNTVMSQIEHQTLMRKYNVRTPAEAQKKFLELK